MTALPRLHATTRRLLAARALRSLGQGALVVSFSLYLDALGWRAASIGLLFAVSSLFGAGLSVAVGVLTDRIGRKPFLLVYEGVIVLVGLAAMLSARPGVLVAAAVVGGFGKGQSGAAGPFSAAEGAWLAERVAPKARGMVYSLNSSLGFFGMGLGALLAGAVPVLARWLPGAAAYRPLFALTVLAAAANALLLAGAEGGTRRPAAPARPAREAAPAEGLLASGRSAREENRALLLLALTNAFNGVAIGLTGPLIAYWFALRFGVGPGSLGWVFGLTFLGTALAALWTGRLSARLGIVRSVVAVRLIGLALLVALPLLPRYGLASTAYALRSAFNRSSAGARQALAVSLASDERRGLAASLNTVSTQLPSALGPALAGALYGAGQLTLPFYLAAALQLAYLGLYGALFRAYEPGRG